MIMKNNQEVIKVLKGTTDISAIMHGTSLVFAPERTVTGVPPLTLTTKVAGAAISYKTQGKVVQNGTPSVQTKTLDLGTLVQDSYVSDTDGAITPYSSWDRTDYVEIPSDMKHITVEVDSAYNDKYNCWYDEDKQFISSFTIWNASSGTKILTADVPANARYVIFSGPRNWMESASVTYNAFRSIPVQGVGERTENLFDKDNPRIYNGYYRSETNQLNSYPNNAYIYTPVEPNKTYYIRNIKRYNSSSTTRWVTTGNTFTDNSDVIRTDLIQPTTAVTVITTRADEHFLGLFVCADVDYQGYGSVSAAITANCANLIIDNGYKVATTNRGKNLFDTNVVTLGKYINAQGVETASTAQTPIQALNHTSYIVVEPNMSYTYRYKYTSGVVNTIALCWFDANKSLISRVTKNVYEQDKEYTLSGISPANAAYCIINFTGYVPNETMELSFNLGSTATPYEPYREPITTTLYTDKPLYGIGTSTDCLQRLADGSGVEHRALHELVLTGEESWEYATVQGHKRFSWNAAYLTSDRTVGICTHYKYETVTDDGNIFHTSSLESRLIYIVDDRFSSAADFKAYLAAQYAAGTPVTVWYVLAAPTDTPVTLPPLMLVKGVNVLDVAGDVKPTSMTLTVK